MNRRETLLAGGMAALAPAASEARTGGRRNARRGGFVETREGVRLFHRDWGEGAPIVFVSGWTPPVGCMGALIPGAELRIYEDAPHGVFITHAARLNADIAAFARG